MESLEKANVTNKFYRSDFEFGQLQGSFIIAFH